MSLIINKFGGGILKDAEAIKHLSEVFEKCVTQNSINVISAFGKTTNNLERAVFAFTRGDVEELDQSLNELKQFHYLIATELFPKGHTIFSMIEAIFQNIRHILYSTSPSADGKFIYDQIVPYGEIVASLIVSNYLSSVGISNQLINATDFLKTDSNFGSANVDKVATLLNLQLQMSADVLKLNTNIVTQGFIGFSAEGMTTLGREGSDYTAGILGNLMNAEKVILWKDVLGVMDKNPNLAGNEDAKKIDFMTYDELEKSLKTTGKGLVHPKTLNEVKEKKIPLQVRPFWDLDSEGTIIGK